MKRGIIRRQMHFILIGLFLVLIISSFVSAGFFDWFKNTITGRASTQTYNASITVTGTSKVNITVDNGTIAGTINDPTENNDADIIFYVTVSDIDGVSDINDTSIIANFSRPGESLRSNSSCVLIADIDSTSANYSCTVRLQYFEGSGEYNITVGATDLGNTTYVYNTTRTFQYDQLQAIVISSNSLTWPSVSPGQVNQTSNNDPTIINNTGNYNSPNLTINARNLHGETVTTTFINVANLTAGNNTGSSAECDFSPTNNATLLTNGTDVQILKTSLTRGNHSKNTFNSTGQEQIFYCINQVPASVSSQVYSTTNGGSWTIKVT